MAVTELDLRKVYEGLETATESYQIAGVNYERAKEQVELAVTIATASGEIQGKNETERKAMAFQMFENDYIDLNKKEADYKDRANELAIAKIHLDFIRDCIRIEELAKK